MQHITCPSQAENIPHIFNSTHHQLSSERYLSQVSITPPAFCYRYIPKIAHPMHQKQPLSRWCGVMVARDVVAHPLQDISRMIRFNLGSIPSTAKDIVLD